MKIAVHAADLDHKRIDGTRVYLLNMLKNFGRLDQNDFFDVYHQHNFNQFLTPPAFKKYRFKSIPFPIIWTQTRFSFHLWQDDPDVLWMPVQNIPAIRRSSLKTVVTVHDLAFKFFPELFPKKDLRKLNFLTDCAIKMADGIIAVSVATKKDILRFYPKIKEDKIRVIHHGFDRFLFQKKVSESESKKTLSSFKLKSKEYLLYVGAIQPRKNLIVLVEAFEKIKNKYPDLKLLIAGAPAWNFDRILERINKSIFSGDIIITGEVEFRKLPVLYNNARVFVFPSLYEGFGIPVLEAMACGVPTVLAENSSLPEVGGKAATYFNAESSEDLAICLEKNLSDENLAKQMIEKGLAQVQNFSWEKSAEETLDFIKSFKK
ncbi:MAG: glycosyltransferase family 4 protein [Candidatus Moranbacteria bacterium]|nr:glycosyltransferase family 4 protein [Candidatus Moranbacteria bacterium]